MAMNNSKSATSGATLGLFVSWILGLPTPPMLDAGNEPGLGARMDWATEWRLASGSRG